MDDETHQALLLFNRRAEADEAAAETARKVSQAEKAKNEATQALQEARDTGSGAEAVAVAEAEWRSALETLQRLHDGEEPEADEDTPTEEPEADEDTKD
ncbi:MAG: hypothetical protein VX833_04050 [Actinomycetota bacterium]|nr:hypothetical protein [Actinomycetota bacterium]